MNYHHEAKVIWSRIQSDNDDLAQIDLIIGGDFITLYHNKLKP